MAGSNFADGKGNATVYATYLNTSPAVGNQFDYAGCTLNSAGAAPAPGAWNRSPAVVRARAPRAASCCWVRRQRSNYATLADDTVDANTGLFRQYTSADSYNYGAASYRSARRSLHRGRIPELRHQRQHERLFRLHVRAQHLDRQLRPERPVRVRHALDQLLQPAVQPVELARPVHARRTSPPNQATFGGTGDASRCTRRAAAWKADPRLDNYSSNSFREVIGIKGSWTMPGPMTCMGSTASAR